MTMNKCATVSLVAAAGQLAVGLSIALGNRAGTELLSEGDVWVAVSCAAVTVSLYSILTRRESQLSSGGIGTSVFEDVYWVMSRIGWWCFLPCAAFVLFVCVLAVGAFVLKNPSSHVRDFGRLAACECSQIASLCAVMASGRDVPRGRNSNQLQINMCRVAILSTGAFFFMCTPFAMVLAYLFLYGPIYALMLVACYVAAWNLYGALRGHG